MGSNYIPIWTPYTVTRSNLIDISSSHNKPTKRTPNHDSFWHDGNARFHTRSVDSCFPFHSNKYSLNMNQSEYDICRPTSKQKRYGPTKGMKLSLNCSASLYSNMFIFSKIFVWSFELIFFSLIRPCVYCVYCVYWLFVNMYVLEIVCTFKFNEMKWNEKNHWHRANLITMFYRWILWIEKKSFPIFISRTTLKRSYMFS